MILDDDKDKRSPTERLLAQIETFIKARGVSAATFGVYVLGDGKMVDRLRAGGKIHLDNAKRVLDAMDDWDAVKARFAQDSAAQRARTAGAAKKRPGSKRA
jgi:hypothetical protein